MKGGLRLALIAMLLISVSQSARAQVTLGASCSTSGSITIQPNQIVYCTGSIWAIGEEILSSGYVGIGTVAPASLLDIEGTVSPEVTVGSANTTDTSITLTNTSTGGHAWTWSSTGSANGAGVGISGFYDTTASQWALALADHTASFDSNGLITWSNTANNPRSGIDGGISRLAGAKLAIGNGTQGDYSGTLISGNIGIGNTGPGALLDVGAAGSTRGTFRLEGNTSGYVQLQTAAAAGSWTMTLPTNTGTSGYVLSTDGSGTTSWIANGSGGTSTLGTSASVTSPQRTGDPTTGLFSAATSTVAVSVGGAQQLTVNTTGVGIGTALPAQPLDVVSNNGFDTLEVVSNANIAAYAQIRAAANSGSPYGAAIRIDSTAISGGHNWMLFSSGAGAGQGTGKLVFQDGTAGYDRLTLDGSGNVGIGTTGPGYPLTVNGQAVATSFMPSSDQRLKKNIHPLQEALDLVDRLRGVSYDWRTPEEREIGQGLSLPTDEHQIGVIAQEVEKVYPEVVRTDNNGVKNVNYNALVGPLIEAVKELHRQLKAEQTKIEIQQQKIDELSKGSLMPSGYAVPQAPAGETSNFPAGRNGYR